MSSVATSRLQGAASPDSADTEWLRCPGERTAFVICAVSNVVVLAVAVAVVLAEASWLGTHPLIARHVGWMRTVVLAAIFALPALPIGRHLLIHATRDNSVRVTEHQFPELHAELLRACRKLGLERVPALYVSSRLDGVAAAYSVLGKREVVLINAKLFDKRWTEGLDWLTFVMAGALGSIRLGHTRWWVELLTVYTRRIPGLRTPLLLKWAYSRDRCAAFVVPDGIRGLIVEAVGKNAVLSVDPTRFVEQVEHVGGVWDFLVGVQLKSPPLAVRARALYEAGFFDVARDMERHASRAPA